MNENKIKSLLQYKSNEMIPSTQLIRKSKQIFDSITRNEIEKAIILRDGKPSFILMDFEKYEKIINSFINSSNSIDKELALLDNFVIEEKNKSIQNKESVEIINKEIKSKKDILLEKLDSIEGIINNDKNEINEKLKDFWE